MKRKNNKYSDINSMIEKISNKKIEIEQEISELKSQIIIIEQQIDYINNNNNGKNSKFKVGSLFNRRENTVRKIRKASSKKQKSLLWTLNREMHITRKHISASKSDLKQLCKVLCSLEFKKEHAVSAIEKTRKQNKNETLIINKG